MTESQTPTIQSWLMAARPRTLPAAAAPVFVAIAFALRDGVFHWSSALACLLISLLMQIGANFANDLFDHERGSDTPDRLGPMRVTASGIISPMQMRLGIAAIFGLVALLGLYLYWLRGWSVLALGAAIIIAALAYTRPVSLWLLRSRRYLRFPVFWRCRRLWDILCPIRNAHAHHWLGFRTDGIADYQCSGG
jgi:1,4-dihydroxy-2-naphthoate octaprenyltransferase